MADDKVEVEVTAETAGFDAGLERVLGGLKKFTGVAGVASVAAAGVFLKDSLAEASRFEDSLSVVEFKLGLTAEESTRLAESLDFLNNKGAAARYSQNALAAALAGVVEKGKSAREALHLVGVGADFAAATHQDLGGAVSDLNSILEATGASTGSARSVAEQLTAAYQMMGGSVEGNTAQLKEAISVSRAWNVSLAENAATLDVLKDAGNFSISTLYNGFNQLLQPGEDLEALLRKYNVAVRDVNGNLRPLVAIFGDLKETQEAARISSSAAAAEINVAFGARAGGAVNAYIGNLDDVTAKTEDVAGAHGVMSDSVKKSLDDQSTKTAELGSQWSDLMAKVGGAAAPVANSVVGAAADALGGLNFFLDSANTMWDDFIQGSGDPELLRERWRTAGSEAGRALGEGLADGVAGSSSDVEDAARGVMYATQDEINSFQNEWVRDMDGTFSSINFDTGPLESELDAVASLFDAVLEDINRSVDEIEDAWVPGSGGTLWGQPNDEEGMGSVVGPPTAPVVTAPGGFGSGETSLGNTKGPLGNTVSIGVVNLPNVKDAKGFVEELSTDFAGQYGTLSGRRSS